jgi:hypothetical protein
VKTERATRIAATPRLRSWVRLSPTPVVWATALGGVFIGPTVRQYSTVDFAMWIGVAVAFPVAVWILLASRYRRLYAHAERSTNGRFWIFTDGILVPALSESGERHKARRVRRGWITTNLSQVVVVEDRGTPAGMPPMIEARVEQVSLVRLMRLFFEPVTRIVFADGTRLDVNLVRPGFNDIIGYRMKDYIALDRSLS